jgi:cytochrome c oxidase subunit 3/cytochrome o ubiquinol oxidase subunit 3
MSATPLANPEEAVRWKLPSRGKVGMFALIAAETAIFAIFVVAYIFYLGKSLTGPTPRVLQLPVFISVCLLSSSATIHFAVGALRKGKVNAFAGWWLLTFTLGAIFLAGTAREWMHLIRDEGLSIDTNLFGTTYYSLVGLHAFHVTAGLLLLGTVAAFTLLRQVRQEHAGPVDVLSLYWHFVDVVWVVVFTVVYVIGR